MTTRQTAAFAAILLVGCGNPQPPTVEDFTEAAQPIPTPEPQTATIETPDVPLWEAPELETSKRSGCIWLAAWMQMLKTKVGGHRYTVHPVRAKGRSLNYFWPTARK